MVPYNPIPNLGFHLYKVSLRAMSTRGIIKHNTRNHMSQFLKTFHQVLVTLPLPPRILFYICHKYGWEGNHSRHVLVLRNNGAEANLL
jgi:hypothetical protein